MLSTRVGRRGQIVLPKEVRMKIRVEEGDQIAFVIDGEQVIIKPITHNLLDMRGRIHVAGKQDFDSIRQQAKQSVLVSGGARMDIETVFVDTNLFLRYLTNDIPAQADAVEFLFKRASKEQIHLITSSMVIAEIVWTLESYYELDKKGIQVMVLGILNTIGLEVTDTDLILQAIILYVDKNVDFIDTFNAAWMAKNNVNKIYTFDQKHFNRLTGILSETPK